MHGFLASSILEEKSTVGLIRMLGERLKESHFLLQHELQLHSKTLDTKRPLLSLRPARKSKAIEEGSRPSRFRRIIYASTIGFTVLTVGASIVMYLL